MPESLTIGAGVLAGNEAQIATYLMAATEAIRRSKHQHKGQRCDGSHAGMRHQPQHLRPFACLLLGCCGKPWIVVFNRSTNSSRSCRRRVAHGASGSASSCLRPVLLHSVFLRRTPSFIAAAWIWFMARVAFAPGDADARLAGVDHGSPDSGPRSGESDSLPVA